MTSQRPVLSIVIPTYNRAGPLFHTLQTCVAQSYDKVEFIVQDDASTDETAQVVARFAEVDPRIRYVNIGTNAGMRRNFEQALQSARGDYLLCMGGDDALIPETLTELAELIVRFPSDVITWPTASFHYGSVRAGKSQLLAPHAIFRQPTVTKLRASEYLVRQAAKLFYVNDQKSPMLYVKSCVPMKLLKVVAKKSGGEFFKSSTPDGYSSFALASIIEDYVYTNSPFTMHGVSPSSAGLNYVVGKGGKEDYSEKFFSENRSVPMAPQLAASPYSPLITLMTADFLFQTDNIFAHNISRNISIESIIRGCLMELSDGLFNVGKINRELIILNDIAKFHKVSDLFTDLLRKSRRNSRSILTGDVVSPSLLYLDGERRGLQNVNDAANFLKAHRNSRRIYGKINPTEAIANAVGYKMQSYKLRESLADYF